MIRATQNGAIIAPPVTSFYTKPQTIDDLVDHTVARVMDLLGIHADVPRWKSEAMNLAELVHSPDRMGGTQDIT